MKCRPVLPLPKAHAIEETVALATTGALPETEQPLATPDSVLTQVAEPIGGDLRTKPAPSKAGIEPQLLPAPDDGLERSAQPEAGQADRGEEQTIEPGSSPAATAMPVSEDARASQESPAELPYVEMEQSAAPIPVPATEELNDWPDAVEAVVDEIEAPPPVSGEAASLAVDAAEAIPQPPHQRRPRAYRDRRGSRRAGLSGAHPSSAATRAGVGVAPAEAFLRLSLHPIQRTVRLSLVLARPGGFPEQITLATVGHPIVHAYDDWRYDDIDVPAGTTLLVGELRFNSLEPFRWLRSARRVQIFSTAPSEPDLISVSAVRAGAEHAVLCRHADVVEVRRIAELAGSPALVSHDGWPGVPRGCALLSAYCPVRAIAESIEPPLRTLDPGASTTIGLSGLAIRASVFAQGHPPLISIDGLPEGTVVSIGGENAEQNRERRVDGPGLGCAGTARHRCRAGSISHLRDRARPGVWHRLAVLGRSRRAIWLVTGFAVGARGNLRGASDGSFKERHHRGGYAADDGCSRYARDRRANAPPHGRTSERRRRSWRGRIPVVSLGRASQSGTSHVAGEFFFGTDSGLVPARPALDPNRAKRSFAAALARRRR